MQNKPSDIIAPKPAVTVTPSTSVKDNAAVYVPKTDATNFFSQKTPTAPTAAPAAPLATAPAYMNNKDNAAAYVPKTDATTFFSNKTPPQTKNVNVGGLIDKRKITTELKNIF